MAPHLKCDITTGHLLYSPNHGHLVNVCTSCCAEVAVSGAGEGNGIYTVNPELYTEVPGLSTCNWYLGTLSADGSYQVRFEGASWVIVEWFVGIPFAQYRVTSSDENNIPLTGWITEGGTNPPPSAVFCVSGE